MALNKAVFKTRALTAIVFAVVMLAGLFWNYWSLLVLFSVIHFGGWLEYISIIEKMWSQKFTYYFKASLVCGAFAVALSCFFFRWIVPGMEIWNFMIPVFGIASFVLLIGNLISLKKEIFSKPYFAALAGVAYISLSIGSLFWLTFHASFPRGPESCSLFLGKFLIIFIIVSIWINDTMAYIVGSFIGKTPFSKISPKKTWEGTIGGIVLCIAVMSLLGKYIYVFKDVETRHWIIISALCAVAGTFGDLLESKLKRMAGIKDSGSFMPGHGGFLDRFDSLLVAAPCVWLYMKFIAGPGI